MGKCMEQRRDAKRMGRKGQGEASVSAHFWGCVEWSQMPGCDEDQMDALSLDVSLFQSAPRFMATPWPEWLWEWVTPFMVCYQLESFIGEDQAPQAAISVAKRERSSCVCFWDGDSISVLHTESPRKLPRGSMSPERQATCSGLPLCSFPLA